MAGAQPIDIQEIQAGWLREWHRYMVSTYAADCIDALEMGCGSGFVMRNLSEQLRVKGIDLDEDQVFQAGKIGMDAEQGDAHGLDIEDSSYDLVYCSFFLMWVEEPNKVLDEMIRIARQKIIIFSEPVWSRTVHSPMELEELVDNEIGSIKDQGGDPDFGIALLRSLKDSGLRYRFGTVPMDTSIEDTRKWVDVEIRYLERQGREIPAVDPELFHVPFIWAVIDLS